MTIYHRNIGFPPGLLMQHDIVLNLGYTTHAKSRMYREEFKILVLPTVVKVTPNNIVEIYTDDGKTIKKLLMRIPYDYSRDLVLVIEPIFKKEKAKVITFWVNHKKDQHPGLDMSKYTVPI